MSISRVVARPLLSAMFVAGGWDAIKNPSGKAKKAESVALPIAEQVPLLPQDPERLVQINGAVMVGAGTLLAIGKFRRLAALTLMASIIPTTYAGHRFWEEDDEATKAQQRVHFLKNLGLLGGLILEAVDTEGAPSLTWRATHRKNRKRSSGSPELGETSQRRHRRRRGRAVRSRQGKWPGHRASEGGRRPASGAEPAGVEAGSNGGCED